MLLVPGRPSPRALLFWSHGEAAGAPSLRPRPPGARVFTLPLSSLAPSGTPPFRLVVARDLDPNARYTLRWGGAEVSSTTLPRTLAEAGSFTIALGSCFDHPGQGAAAYYPPPMNRDLRLALGAGGAGGRARAAGAPGADGAGGADGAARKDGADGDPIRLRFLCGDQLYIDVDPFAQDKLEIAADTLLGRTFQGPDVWRRYDECWSESPFRTFMAESPTIAQADDHEFWNDFPHEKIWIGWADKDPNSRIQKDLQAAYAAFQLALNLDPEALEPGTTEAEVRARLSEEARCLSLDVPPLSFFALDTRSARTVHDAPGGARFAVPGQLEQAIAWLRSLRTPGVLMISQPILVARQDWFRRTTHLVADWTLPDYVEDYTRLLDALFAARADVVIITGDLHWSRLSLLTSPPGVNRVYEVVSSPMNLLHLDEPSDDETRMDQWMGAIRWKSPGGGGRRADVIRMSGPLNARSTFATLTFSAVNASQVETVVRFWTARPDQPGLASLYEAKTMMLRSEVMA